MSQTEARPNVVHARFSEAEKRALIALTRIEHRSRSEMLRELVREAARERGIWPMRHAA